MKLETQEDAVASSFMQAQMWSITNGVPVHMGEFGAYEPRDIDSRERWTTAVRSWSESLDIPFSSTFHLAIGSSEQVLGSMIRMGVLGERD